MHWILQSNFMDEPGWDVLVETLERFNIPYSEHKVIPFIGELLPAYEGQKNAICVGSYSMLHIAKKLGLYPGVFDLFDQDFTKQLEHWGDNMLNAGSQVVKFKNAQINAATFIRPIDDSKYFAGRVFWPEEFHEWKHLVCDLKEDYGTSLTGETYIQLAAPREIYTEVRYWIVDDRIVTRSIYKEGDRVIYKSNVDDRFDWYASSLVSRISVDYWRPADAYVLDICETSDGMKIVEINTINAAGFYAGDVQKIVMALEGFGNRRQFSSPKITTREID